MFYTGVSSYLSVLVAWTADTCCSCTKTAVCMSECVSGSFFVCLTGCVSVTVSMSECISNCVPVCVSVSVEDNVSTSVSAGE